MMMKIGKYLGAAAFAVLLHPACSESPEDAAPMPGAGPVLSVRFEAEGALPVRTAEADDAAIGRVTGFRFVQGTLHEILEGESPSEGLHTFYPTALEGELHFVANAPEGLFDALRPGGSTLAEFLALGAPVGAMVSDRVLMTGRMELPAESGRAATVRMTRSVARVDLVSEERGVEVRSVSIRPIADRGYLFAQEHPAVPADAGETEFRREYGEGEFMNSRRTLLYLCEQPSGGMTAEVVVAFGGGLHRMTAAFPADLVRNRIYVLRVHGAGADASVSVSGGTWEEGASVGTTPAPGGLIDPAASSLPEGVTLNAAQDSVRVDSRGGEFRLAVRAEAGTEVEIEGLVRGVTASVEPAARSFEPVATVAVSAGRRLPGESRAYLYLNIVRDSVRLGRIALLFEPNPVQLSGGIVLDGEGNCDFDRYVDGELGRLTLPEGKVARVEFDADEDPWLKLDGEGRSLRILAGWKPNDPKADGRVQEGRIVISQADGSDVERYAVRRRNWGLPVVEIGGVWWCKYNLRGNVKEFADQIPIGADPADADALADYLASCDEGELLRLLGDQYQAGNPEGLPLRHDGASFYYEGMQSAAQNFGSIDPAAMAPDGYRIPGYDDYAFFAGSRNYNLGGVGTRSYRNMAGDELTVRILEREATLLGQRYGTMALYEFRSGGACWVLCGLGHQWNTTAGNISPMMLLLATAGDGTNSWVLEGYAQADRPGQNWLKFVGQNSTKTRMIRCVKTPVEYMYD